MKRQCQYYCEVFGPRALVALKVVKHKNRPIYMTMNDNILMSLSNFIILFYTSTCSNYRFDKLGNL